MNAPDSWAVLVVAVLVAFLIGSISPATMVAKRRKADLSQGSGNPGATNAGRVIGLKYGIAVGGLDVLKGLVPALLALWLTDRFTAYAVGLGTVLGHMFSPILRGHGGKGVATSLGAVLALLPWFAVVMVVLFGLIVLVGRWVALASLSAAVVLVVLASLAPVPDPEAPGRTFALALGLLVAIRHVPNLRARLASLRP